MPVSSCGEVVIVVVSIRSPVRIAKGKKCKFDS